MASRKPLVPENRALLNVSYGTVKENWKFDFTAHYQGETKLAVATGAQDDLTGHDDNQVKNGMSTDFFTFNAQITYLIKKWELYLGSENLTDFRQETPVINAMQPFDEGFDATNVWGPVMGRKIYFGFRYTLKAKKSIQESNK